ncbi:MAG: hypothetical protein AAF601_13870 [Pseudomonadota bacterium]
MHVILHVGSHRTATTSFQGYLRRHVADLQAMQVACWGPRLTRKGLFAGIHPQPGAPRDAARRARGRILLRMQKAKQDIGARTLLVSDENIMGAVGRNLRLGRFYDDVGTRVARHVSAFDGQVREVVVTIRGLDMYWASAAAYAVQRGYPVPPAATWAHLSRTMRSWRDVITDIACAAPDARIRVLPFEWFVGRPDAQLAAVLGCSVPADTRPQWLNRSPNRDAIAQELALRGTPSKPKGVDTRWIPFSHEVQDAFREHMADDMHWLIAGADGLATLTEGSGTSETGQIPPSAQQPRGHDRDIEERRLAQHR